MSDAPISPEAIARVDVELAAARPAPADDFPCCSTGACRSATTCECPAGDQRPTRKFGTGALVCATCWKPIA